MTPTLTCVALPPSEGEEPPVAEDEDPHPVAAVNVTAAMASPMMPLCMGPS
jgi:hypothetical protein